MKNSKYIIVLFLLILASNLLYASDIVYIAKKERSTIGVSTFLEVQDPHGFAVAENTHFLSRTAQVHLIYGRENHTDIEGEYWAYEIDFELNYWDTTGAIQTVRDTFEIRHDEDDGIYNNLKIYENIPTGRAKIVIKGIRARQGTGGSWGSNSIFIPSDIRLELQLHVQLYDEFSTIQLQADHEYTNTGSDHNIDIRWNYILGQEAAELEYVFWDSTYLDTVPVNNPKLLFAFATRIETNQQHYEIELTYPGGTLFYRVRPVGYYVNGVSDDHREHRHTGAWSAIESQAISPFEAGKSWQYTTSFAEEGKSKKVLSYFDGTMRSRQVITFLNDANLALVGESDYSVEGQSMITILPAPSNDDNLFFKASFNKNAAGSSYSYRDFDKATGADSLKHTSGAGKYYSPSHSGTTDIHRDYIPDAEGYPLVQMRYTRDNTGKVARQGGVGAFYHLTSDRAMQYHYGSVSNTELRRLFGSNIGNSNHYKKTLALDANGQGTISYIDQTGNTVATTLAGGVPTNVHELSSAAVDTVTKDLMDPNEIDSILNVSSLEYGLLNTMINNVYSFYYELTGTYNYLTLNGIEVCKTCSYELEITVQNPDGIYLIPTSLTGAQLESDTIVNQQYHRIVQTFSGATLSSCGADSAYSTTAIEFDMLFATVGSYRVSKQLRLVSGSLNEQFQYLDSLGVLPDSSAIADSLISQIDSTQCLFYGGVDTLSGLIDEVFEWASEAECEGFYSRMKNQIRESYKFGIELITDSLCLANNTYIVKDVYGYTWEVEFDGTGDMLDVPTSISVNLDIIGRDGSTITIGSLAEFISAVNDSLYYQEGWTESLVTCHREYCHYQYCMDLVPARVFSLKLALYKTEANFIDSTGVTPSDDLMDFYNLDPYSLIDSCGFWDSLDYWIGPSIPLIIDYIDTAHYNTNMTSLEEDSLIWHIFIGMYNAKKQELIDLCNPCSIFEDNLALKTIQTFPDPNDSEAVDSIINLSYENYCEMLCPVKADIWMFDIARLLEGCEEVLTSSDSIAIRSYLETYCHQSCGLSNPLGILLQEDFDSGAYPSLTLAMNIVETYIDSCAGASIDSLFSPFSSVYTYTTDSLGDTLYTVRTIPFHEYFDGDCYSDIILTLNQGLQAPNRTFSSTPYNLTINIPCFNLSQESVSFALYDGVGFGIEPVGLGCTFIFQILSDTSCGSNAVTWDSILWVQPLGIQQAEPCWEDYSSNDFVQIAMHKIDSTIDTVFVHVYGGEYFCPTILDTILLVIPILDSNATYTYDLDSNYWECIQMLVNTAIMQGADIWQEQVDSLLTLYANSNKCWEYPFEETFRVTYQEAEYHYTLYYYDQAGSLIQTVPPLAVEPLEDIHFPNGIWDNTEPTHKGFHLATNYQYNSLGQVVEQTSPDGGTTVMFYDDVQRLRMSQNAKQATEDSYSYTKYDDQSRPIEVGQLESFVSTPTSSQLNNVTFPESGSYTLTQQIFTTYDERTGTTYTGENLRGRVAQIENEYVITTYDYDILGNVNHIQHTVTDFRSFDIYYDYDLASGNVNEVHYQPGEVDAFHHRYYYDADNRLQIVETSDDGYLWNQEAHYLYYVHGPLARVELSDAVQGLDYYYNLQGWIMGVNMPNHQGGISSTSIRDHDLGKDAQITSDNENEFFGMDAFAYGLGYHEQAYTPIGSINMAALTDVWTDMDSDILENSSINGFFNGNIAFMVSQVTKLATLGVDATASQYAMMGTAYQYDQLHRIRQSRSYAYTEAMSSYSWVGDNLFDTDYDYDGNGNILTLKRKVAGTIVDSLTYNYKTNGSGQPLHNQLLGIADGAGDNPSIGDLKDQSAVFENYQYDEIGNLTQDTTEGVDTIYWTIQGKVERVVFMASTGKPDLFYTYDPMGNRLSKSDEYGTTYYIRDAQGNVLSIYEKTEGVLPVLYTQAEVNIYGSTRLGSKKATQIVRIDSSAHDIYYPTERTSVYLTGYKFYELSNHLGNVLATVTDKKVGKDTSSNGQANYYVANTRTATLYYPFGWETPGRQVNPNDSRHGFNGQEKSPEISNGHTTAQFWEYDARSIRRWNIDPKPIVYISPYATFQGNPIYNADPKGDTIIKEKINHQTKNVAIIHLKPEEIDKGLGDDWKGEMEGWSYVVTDDLADAEKWLNANFTSEEVDNLAVRLHSAGFNGNIIGVATWDKNGIRSTTTPESLNGAPAGFRFDEQQQNALVGIVNKLDEGGTLVLAPCDLASGTRGIGNADLDFVLGMSRIARQSSITIMMNTVQSNMYSALNSGFLYSEVSTNKSNPYTWIKFERIGGLGITSTTRYSVAVTSYSGFSINERKDDKK